MKTRGRNSLCPPCPAPGKLAIGRRELEPEDVSGVRGWEEGGRGGGQRCAREKMVPVASLPLRLLDFMSCVSWTSTTPKCNTAGSAVVDATDWPPGPQQAQLGPALGRRQFPMCDPQGDFKNKATQNKIKKQKQTKQSNTQKKKQQQTK